jgi:NADPH:quinone reductase-like Zn-dependent oxidoreductase
MDPHTTDSRATGPRATAAVTATSTMRAVVQRRYGGSDVLQLAQVPRPVVRDDQVLVRVHAAGLDRGTEHLMTGKPYAVRLASGIRRPRNPVPGRDVAGTVVKVGAGVSRFAPGDEVFGVAPGSFAEYAVAPEGKLAPMPGDLSFAEAAVVPVSAGTALQAIAAAGTVEAGRSVLVTGASGGVGSYAVQLAVDLGAEVTGVCSAAKAELVRALGAQHVLDYAHDDWTDGTRRYDVILDIAGNTPVAQLRRALTRHGTVVFVGGEQGGSLTGMGRQLRGALLSPFIRHRLVVLLARERAADYEHLARLVEAGRLVPALDRRFPLERAGEAVQELEAGTIRGKVALTA